MCVTQVGWGKTQSILKMDGRSLKSHFLKRGPRKTWMIHPIKTNGSSPPPPPRGPRGPQRAWMMNTKNTRLRLTELSASAATGARTPPLGCCSSTFLDAERKYSSHVHHSAPALKTIPRSSCVLWEHLWLFTLQHRYIVRLLQGWMKSFLWMSTRISQAESEREK